MVSLVMKENLYLSLANSYSIPKTWVRGLSNDNSKNCHSLTLLFSHGEMQQGPLYLITYHKKDNLLRFHLLQTKNVVIIGQCHPVRFPKHNFMLPINHFLCQ